MNASKIRSSRFALLAFLGAFVMTGCAGGSSRSDGSDPLEGVNRAIYRFNDGLDRAFIKPVAETYVRITPRPIRTSVTNFFDNLGYVNVVANDLLQGKFRQGFRDSARFLLNSTVGIGGLFDPANHTGLVKNEEDLGQTFGTWGFGEGAFLVLPLRGPNSLRDAPDLATSALLNPLFYASSAVAFPIAAINAVNQRANLLEATRLRDEAALDAYSFTREAYRQSRVYDTHDGNPPADDLEYIAEEGADKPGDLVVN
ncbi:MAG: MlaA family lipoprotein [Chromatiales bacterium]